MCQIVKVIPVQSSQCYYFNNPESGAHKWKEYTYAVCVAREGRNKFCENAQAVDDAYEYAQVPTTRDRKCHVCDALTDARDAQEAAENRAREHYTRALEAAQAEYTRASEAAYRVDRPVRFRLSLALPSSVLTGDRCFPPKAIGAEATERREEGRAVEATIRIAHASAALIKVSAARLPIL